MYATEGPARADTFDGCWHLTLSAVAERKAANRRRREKEAKFEALKKLREPKPHTAPKPHAPSIMQQAGHWIKQKLAPLNPRQWRTQGRGR
jgi:hypothetical protein